jgi:S-adenosylmethionine-dependent methyltransferase
MLDRATAFAQHAAEWEQYTATPLGRLRQELVIAHLLQHLRSRRAPLTVLDAGAGSGGYDLALARQGHRVCLLDLSEEMLAIARQALREANGSVEERVDFCRFPVEQAAEHFPPGHFEVVLAHTLLEYVEEPWSVLRALVHVLAPGGLLSLLVVNPHADAFRMAWAKKDLIRARQALTECVSQADLFGLPRRILPPSRIRQELSDARVKIVAEYGIRIFADYFSGEELADAAFTAKLWELEMEASRLEPYKRVARYLHLVGVRQPSSERDHGTR